MLRAAKLVSFAQWRWGTLAKVCESLSGFLTSLAENFDPEPFKDQRDKVEFKNVLAALKSPQWHNMFSFVRWYTEWLTPLQEWIGGCPCHEPQEEGAKDCPRKGRRIVEAHTHAVQILDAGLADANDWLVARFGGDVDLWREGQGVVRFTVALAKEKIGHLDKVPYLLARLSEPGIRDRCLEQFQRAAPSEHHRVTRWFVDPDHAQSLRQDIENMSADGSNMSPALEMAVESLKWVPMDDCICEGPHARAKRIKMPASAAKWPWVATSLRLQQDIEDCMAMPDKVGLSLRAAWTSYASVVQPPSKEGKFPRLKSAHLDKRLYRIEHLLNFKVGSGARDDDRGGGDDGVGGGGGGDGEVRGACEDQGAPDADEAGGAGGGGEVPPLGVGSKPLAVLARQPRLVDARRSADIILLREFFAATMEPLQYFTLPVVGEAGDALLHAFQLLDVERKNMVVRPFLDEDERAELSGLYTVTVQPLELWSAWGRRREGRQAPPTLDCFPLLEPCKMDLITACGARAEGRRGILMWETRQSDVEACVELYNRQSLTSLKVDLMSSTASVLSLLDILAARGFRGVDEQVTHRQGCLVFDQRCLTGRRAYLQCVVHTQQIFDKNIDEFSSSGSQAYFLALLRGKSRVEPGLPALAYQRLLAIERGEDPALVDEKYKPRPPRPRALPAPAPAPQPIADADGASSSGGSVAGGDDEDLKSEADVAGAGQSAAPEAPAPPMAPLALAGDVEHPPFILGARVSVVRARASTTHTYHERLTVKCTNPAHPRCSRSRSCALLRDQLGPRCAEAFLGAWLQKAPGMSGHEHTRHAPSLDEMRAYLRENE